MREILRILSNGGIQAFSNIGQVDAVCKALGIMPSAVEIMGVRANRSFSVRLKDGWGNAGQEAGRFSVREYSAQLARLGNIISDMQGFAIV